MKKRLGIFLFFDREGKADRYIDYMLKDIRPCLEHLVVIVNGEADEAAMEMFRANADEVVRRENVGFDIGAWQYGILDVVGKEKLSGYDTLLLFNDSFFGPLFPFSEVFSEMDAKELDFWGLSVHGAVPGTGECPYGYRPRYIQTYFMVYEKRLISSRDFWSFWEKQPVYEKYIDMAEQFVAVMTQRFADLGYKWGAFSDTTDIEDGERRNYDQHSFNIYQLISERRYPILKRRSFYADKGNYLTYNNGTEFPRALKYVQEHYDYDMKLVYEHITRLYDPADVKNALLLDYVIPETGGSSGKASKKTAVIARLIYPELFSEYISYIRNVPQGTDVHLITDSGEKSEELGALAEKSGVKARLYVCEPAEDERDVPWKIFDGIIGGYEYACLICDRRDPLREFDLLGKDADRLARECLLRSTGHIERIIDIFEKNEHIGLLAPFKPNHGSFVKNAVTSRALYDELCRICGDAGLSLPQEGKALLSDRCCFWCRTDAVKGISAFFASDPVPRAGGAAVSAAPEAVTEDAEDEIPVETGEAPGEELSGEAEDGSPQAYDHRAIAAVVPYAAMRSGYCTGWVYTQEYAEAQLSAMRYMCDSLVSGLTVSGKLKYTSFVQLSNMLKSKRRLMKSLGVGDYGKKKGLFNIDTDRLKAFIKKITPKFILRIYRKIKY